MSTYTEISFDRAEELWHLGVEIEFSATGLHWSPLLRKREVVRDFWEPRYASTEYGFRVQTE